MPSDKALKLAETISEDLKGAGYYADPKLLAGYLIGATGRTDIDEASAIELVRALLRECACKVGNFKDLLANAIESAFPANPSRS